MTKTERKIKIKMEEIKEILFSQKHEEKLEVSSHICVLGKPQGTKDNPVVAVLDREYLLDIVMNLLNTFEEDDYNKTIEAVEHIRFLSKMKVQGVMFQ